MPSIGASDARLHDSNDDAIPVLSFEQFMDNSAEKQQNYPNDDMIKNEFDDNDIEMHMTSTTPDDEELPFVSTRRLYLMVFADFGLSFTWLCKFAVATPYFQHSLKAGAFLSHLVWIMGPLSGLIVAPVIGVLSDRCTSPIGRRRPFIVLGALFCILGMTIFANAIHLTGGHLFSARLLAVLAFGILDFATNVIMFPSRALLGDLLPSRQQHPAQSAAAVVASIGEICAGAYIYSWRDAVTHIGRIFAVASVLLALSCTVSYFSCQEVPLSEMEEHQREKGKREAVNVISASASHGSIGSVIASVPFQADADAEWEDGNELTAPTREDGRRAAIPVSDNGDDHDDHHHQIENESSLIHTNPTSATTSPLTPTNEDTSHTKDAKIVTHNEIKDEDDDGEDLEIHPVSSATTNHAPSSSIHPNSTLTEPLSSLQQPSSEFRSELVRTIRMAIMNFPRELVYVGVVYGLAWFVWFASLPYYSQWIGVDVLGGDAHAEPGSTAAITYQRGVSIFSVANMFKAGTALVFAWFYPSIIAFVGNIGERVVFSTAFFTFSILLYACANTKSILIAGFVVAAGAIPFIVTQTIPIAIVVQRYPENLASNLGVMNLFCVVPQLVDTLYTGKVAEIAGESVVLKVAACWGFVAAVAALLFL